MSSAYRIDFGLLDNHVIHGAKGLKDGAENRFVHDSLRLVYEKDHEHRRAMGLGGIVRLHFLALLA